MKEKLKMKEEPTIKIKDSLEMKEEIKDKG